MTDPAGTYSGPGASAPTIDPPGTYSGPGASAPRSIRPARIAAGASTPIFAQTGYYVPTAGASSETPDDLGYYTPYPGATAEILLPPSISSTVAGRAMAFNQTDTPFTPIEKTGFGLYNDFALDVGTEARGYSHYTYGRSIYLEARVIESRTVRVELQKPAPKRLNRPDRDQKSTYPPNSTPVPTPAHTLTTTRPSDLVQAQDGASPNPYTQSDLDVSMRRYRGSE